MLVKIALYFVIVYGVIFIAKSTPEIIAALSPFIVALVSLYVAHINGASPWLAYPLSIYMFVLGIYTLTSVLNPFYFYGGKRLSGVPLIITLITLAALGYFSTTLGFMISIPVFLVSAAWLNRNLSHQHEGSDL